MISELRSAGKLYEGGLVQVGDAIGRPEADIEDILDRKMYLDLVNAAYAGALGDKPLALEDLAGSDRVVRVERALRRLVPGRDRTRLPQVRSG